MRFRSALATIILLGVLIPASLAYPSCQIAVQYPLVSPGSAAKFNVSYSGLPPNSPIVIVCRPNVIRGCFADSDSGSCGITCDYPIQGVYTVSGATPAIPCLPALVVVDPNAKPTCILTPETQRANTSLTTRLSATFNNILPNTTIAVFDCDNGLGPTTAGILGGKASATCSYRAETRKEVFMPSATAGGARCSAQVSVIPPSDTEPPNVSFNNMTYRLSVESTYLVDINATDNVEVEWVELYIDDVLVKVMNATPYKYMWDMTGYERGSAHTLKAIARDTFGNTGNSRVHKLYRAANGTRACNLTVEPRYAPIPAAIKATATFFNTSSDVFSAMMSPHTSQNKTEPKIPIIDGVATTILTYESAGTYTPYASDGNISCTAKVYITSSKDVSPPRITLTSPADGQEIMISDEVELKATTTDNVLVNNVEYYLEDRLLANATESPFNSTWNTTNESIGFYRAKAIAYDIAGNPSRHSISRILLFTNKTCGITPSSATLLAGSNTTFSVRCFNYSRTNLSSSLTNQTTVNGTQANFTIIPTSVLATVSSEFACPVMDWTSTLGWSEISPKNSQSSVSFTAQDTDPKLSGTLMARDPVSGVSCTSDITIVKTMSGCALEAESPVVVGSSVLVNISYVNLSKQQEFRVICRPNVATACQASPGAGNCQVTCDYPLLGTFYITASSPTTMCSAKRISVLPYPDLIPPSVSITKPFDGQIVQGMLEVEAYATDNFGVSKVEFYIGGKPLGMDTIPTYSSSLNTSELSNGKHGISAIAYDETGNKRGFNISILVAN